MRDTCFFRELLRAADTLTCPAKLMAAMQSQSVNPSGGSGDVDAAADSFNDGVIHGEGVEVLVSGRSVGW